MEGAKAIAAVLKNSQLSTLRSTPARCLHAMSLPCRPQKCSAPTEHFACRVRRVDGHPLPIDELKGTKPIEKIDLSDKRLTSNSAIIIGGCIKGNVSLKKLMCAVFQIGRAHV